MGQDVVEAQRAFVRDHVVGLDLQVARGVLERVAELGVLDDEVEDQPASARLDPAQQQRSALIISSTSCAPCGTYRRVRQEGG
jgi:hypothetical protein